MWRPTLELRYLIKDEPVTEDVSCRWPVLQQKFYRDHGTDAPNASRDEKWIDVPTVDNE